MAQKIPVPERSAAIMAKLVEAAAAVKRVYCAEPDCRHMAQVQYPIIGMGTEKKREWNSDLRRYEVVEKEVPIYGSSYDLPAEPWTCPCHAAE